MFQKRYKKQGGFTLLELSLVLFVLGIIAVPLIAMYHQHRVEKDIEDTESGLDDVVYALGNYRSLYGRYPCPAPATAQPGDALYGFEYNDDCIGAAPAAGSCADGVCHYTNPSTGEGVLVGSVPFKPLNLWENQSYDTSLNRYTYAVTLPQTSNNSFTVNGGGIGIVDQSDPSVSLVSPADSADFVVISHGKNGFGARSRGGVLGAACGDGAAGEQENCDGDAIFAGGLTSDDRFDDRVRYFAPVGISEWQVSEVTDHERDIHLKNVRGFALGADVDDDLSNSPHVTVRERGTADGVIFASGSFSASRLCEFGTNAIGNCFEPELIGGTLVGSEGQKSVGTSGGMSCYTGAGDEDLFAVGLANKQLECSDEIFVLCPQNHFVSGVDDDGNLICTGLPEGMCPSKEITTFCGSDAVLPATMSGQYANVYSGECRMLPDYDEDFFRELVNGSASVQEVKDKVEALNSIGLTVGECNDYTDPDNMVKDMYLCEDGEWSDGPVVRWPMSVNATNWLADNSCPDSTQLVDDCHDCWCQEHYQVSEKDCDYDMPGTRLLIHKFECPQSSGYTRYIHWVYDFCECEPGVIQDDTACDYWYSDRTPDPFDFGLKGRVTITYEGICENGQLIKSGDPIGADTSDCRCVEEDDVFDYNDCPVGQTNNWFFQGQEMVNVESIEYTLSTCPDAYIVDEFGNKIPKPVYWEDEATFGPVECACDDSIKKEVTKPCEDEDLGGEGLVYEVEWDCDLNDWEPENKWTKIREDCRACEWQKQGNATESSEFFKVEEGDVCACGTSPNNSCRSHPGKNYAAGCECALP
ncbi:MAG: type II secretion system protein [Alphaproteobacteria bacterium]